MLFPYSIYYALSLANCLSNVYGRDQTFIHLGFNCQYPIQSLISFDFLQEHFHR